MREQERIAQILNIKKLGLPDQPKVVDLKVEPYVDSTGDKAFRVWVIIAEDTPDEDRMWPRVEPVEGVIRKALQDAEVEEFPYIRFRKPSEMVPAKSKS